jgi:hypothetical protein
MSSLGPATVYTSGAKISRGRAIANNSIKRARKKETNKMWKWFAKKIRNAMRDLEREYEVEEVPSRHGMVTQDRCSDERITLRLEKAIGGHIVTVSKYNGKIDRHRENTYLVRDDDNLEEALTAVFIQEKISQ